MTRAMYHGHAGFVNETAWMVAEYNQRKRLAKLGFVQPVDDRSSYLVDAFLIIDEEFTDLESKRRERESKKRGR